MISIYKAAGALVAIVLLLSACSNQRWDSFTASSNSSTTEIMQHIDTNETEDTENGLPASISTNTTEISEHSYFIEPEDTEYLETASEAPVFAYSTFLDFYEQNKRIEIREYISSALMQLDPSEWTSSFKFAADEYYSKFYSALYHLKFQMPDIISVEVVPMPEDLECEFNTVNYAVCLIDRDGNRYTVGLDYPGNSDFVAFWLNDNLLESYYMYG